MGCSMKHSRITLAAASPLAGREEDEQALSKDHSATALRTTGPVRHLDRGGPTESGGDDQAGGKPPRSVRLWIVALCFAALVIDGVDLQALALAAPAILHEWHLTPGQFAPALGATMIGMVIGNLAGGRLGDRFGRRPLLVFSVALFGIVTIATVVASSVWTLSALRLCCGIGFGAAIPNAMAVASEWSSVRARPRVIGLLAIGTPAGGMVAATFAAPLILHSGWRACFLASGALTLAVALAMAIKLAESPTVAPSVAALLPAEVAPVTAPGEASSGYFDRANLASNIAIATAFFANLFACYAMINWLPVIFTLAGATLSASIGASFTYNLLSIAGAFASALALSRLSSRAAGASFLVGSILAVVVLGFFLSAGQPDWRATAAVAASGLFMGSTQAVLYTLATHLYAPAVRATGIGAATAAGRVGGILAIFAGGATLTPGLGVTYFFATLAVSLTVAIAALVTVARGSA